jgi:hypothetical protein
MHKSPDNNQTNGRRFKSNKKREKYNQDELNYQKNKKIWYKMFFGRRRNDKTKIWIVNNGSWHICVAHFDE